MLVLNVSLWTQMETVFQKFLILNVLQYDSIFF